MFKAPGTLLFCIFIFCSTVGQQPRADSILNLIQKSAEDTNRVNHYRNLCGILRLTDPALAIVYGQKGFMLSKKLGFDKGTAGCYMNVSTAYIYSDRLDSALQYLDTALTFARKAGDENRLGLAYLNRADIYRQLQNFGQALKDCDTSLIYADRTQNDDVRARVNQTIGSIYYQQEIYPPSIQYFDKASILYRKVGNLRMSAVVLNNLSLVQKSIKEFAKAIMNGKEAIRITDSLQDITNLSIFTGNLCDVYFEMGNYAEAEKYADKALEYALLQKNEKLMAIAWNFQGNIYAKQKRIPESIGVLEKAFAIFTKLDATDRIQSTGDLLAEVYGTGGQFDKAYKFMRLSQSANDSLVKWRYDDDVTAMQTKFQVKEKDSEIQLLAKDKELQKQKLQQTWLLVVGASALALFALVGAWLVMNRNKLKQRMKELELRNQIAADLHDEVGSSLSSIHMLSQMATRDGSEKTHKDILQRMSNNAKETMDKMGDIVWMIKPGETEAGSLKQRMERFAYEICSSKNIEINMQLQELDKLKLTMEQRKNIYLVFKEALNNAVKYSGTSKMEVYATLENNTFVLEVKDFGKGFDNSIIKKGNGLDNMQNRAKELHADLEIDSVLSRGTTLKMTMPT
jgi:two-component system, NarL family, sensor histidine kinase UhpB